MKCPACNLPSLSPYELENNLQGYKCDQCGGSWISGAQYWKWLNSHGGPLPEKDPQFTKELPVTDSGQAKICIECGHLMIRNKVGHGLAFFLDRCSACGGTWFDKNEWEILKSRNLHDEIHAIFTAVWQSDNRKHEMQTNHENALLTVLGKEDYENLKTLKSWVGKHPKKNWIMAYLLND